jgi:hypothetical protein
MLRRILLSVLAIAFGAMAARAADLPARSRLGAIFADPAEVPRYAYRTDEYRTYEYPVVFAPEVYIPPLVAGYYGKPNSYIYSPYYGGPDSAWEFRLPYACGFYGYC